MYKSTGCPSDVVPKDSRFIVFNAAKSDTQSRNDARRSNTKSRRGRCVPSTEFTCGILNQNTTSGQGRRIFRRSETLRLCQSIRLVLLGRGIDFSAQKFIDLCQPSMGLRLVRPELGGFLEVAEGVRQLPSVLAGLRECESSHRKHLGCSSILRIERMRPGQRLVSGLHLA